MIRAAIGNNTNGDAMQLGQPFLPMEPVGYGEAFDSPEWGFQVKWDGVRILAHYQPQKVVLFNRKQRERSAQYPEIIDALSQIVRTQQVILDGEVVVLVKGAPHFARVLQRDQVTHPKSIHHLQHQLPVHYMVFDLLYLNGRDLSTCSFLQRQDWLREIILPGSLIHPVDTVVEKGIASFNAVVKQDWEGIVAKRLDSPYRFGEKVDLWRKIKNWKRRPLVVGGYTHEQGRPKALLLGAYWENELIYVGRASVGLSTQHRRLLATQWALNPLIPSPFPKPPVLASEAVQWLPVLLVAVIEFLEWTEDLKLRHPKILGFSTDSPENCTL